MWGKIIGATGGFAVGGPIGARLGAKMAKADGVVTRDEVEAFKEVFQIPPEEMKNVSRVFDRARQDAEGFEPYAHQIAGLFEDSPQVLEDLLDGLFHIAKADNVVHPAEIEFLDVSPPFSDLMKMILREFARVTSDRMRPTGTRYSA